MSETVIEVRDLVKTYDRVNVVDHVDLDVKGGYVFSLLGPNGAGKTTTVEILECIRDASSGNISILGMDISRKKDIKNAIGVMPQSFNSFERLTVRESILYFAGMFKCKVDADELIASVKLEEKRDVQFGKLSGGLKQRVGIAISLVNDPDIVFLDEPSTGLDPSARRDVWEVIRQLRKKGKTVFLTTHYMEEAELLSDEVNIMNRGKIICSGSPLQVVSQHGASSTAMVRGGGECALNCMLSRFPGITLEGNDVRVTLDNGKNLVDIIRTLDESEVRYEEITVKRPSLEDVFIKLTGESYGGGE